MTVPSASLALEDKIIDPVLIVSDWLALAKLAESDKSTSLICKVKVCDSLLLPSLAVTVNECEVLVSKSSALASVTSPVDELIANLLSESVIENVTVPSAPLVLELKITEPVEMVSF